MLVCLHGESGRDTRGLPTGSGLWPRAQLDLVSGLESLCWPREPPHICAAARTNWRSAALHCTALHCTALHCTTLNCTALHCTALHCTALHYTTLHCTALHCTVGPRETNQQNSTVPYLTLPYLTLPYLTLLQCSAVHCSALQYDRQDSGLIIYRRSTQLSSNVQ
jgi:hypothetical protein